MLIDDIQNLQTPAKDMLLGLYHDFADAIWIPNSVLPEKYRGKREFQVDGTASSGKIYGRTVRSLNNELDRKKVSRANPDNDERERRVVEYAQMETIEYIENEPRLIRNMITFCNLMIENGVFDKHDFEEE